MRKDLAQGPSPKSQVPSPNSTHSNRIDHLAVLLPPEMATQRNSHDESTVSPHFDRENETPTA